MLELNKLYLMDCMEGMAQFPDKYFDLAIVDPPYGINVAKSGKVGGEKCAKVKDYGAKKWDESTPTQEYFNELKRVSENQIIWGGNYFISFLTNTPSMIVWNKDNTGNFADCELAWTSHERAVKMFTYRWNGMLQGNMKNKETRIHPTQKPVRFTRTAMEKGSGRNFKVERVYYSRPGF